MNKIATTLLMLICTLAAMAQGTVTGRVVDKQTNENLQFVNAVVTSKSTGKLIKGSITDASGRFKIAGLAKGDYTLAVSFVGYKTVQRTFTIGDRQRTASFNPLYIAEDQRTLQEVKVTGQRSQMKLEVDRKTFSVDEVLAAAGGTASDLLENIPSVEVSTEGEVSLRGNTSVEVWINGKASGMTSDNRGDILQQIPAESIEKIEVIDNPSAKYSPEGSAGIINIILKRDRKAGYYGSMRAGTNTKGGVNGGANFNYSSGPLEAYANLGLRRRKNSGGNESQQENYQSQTYQNYEGENEGKGNNLFARAGLTWHATKKDDFSFGGMTMLGKRKDNSFTPYHYGTLGATHDNYVMTRQNGSDGDMNMYNAEVGYVHNFGEKHKIDINAEFSRWTSDGDEIYQDSTDYYTPARATEYSWQNRPLNINNRSWEVKADYENQISDAWKIEAGYNGRFSHENTPQESWADNTSWDGHSMTEDKAYYNRFIYDNDIHALYATVSTKLGKFSLMAGLRGEYWRVETESRTWDQEHDAALRDKPFKKDYFQLFPSLFLGYQITESAQLQLNYTRRLRRPWGGQLNSFKNTSDATNISFGNPYLTPEYTNSFALNFLKSWPDHTLSFGTYYRPTTDVIQRVRYSSGGVMYSTSENVAKSQSAGVELIAKDKLWRILDLTTTINAYYYKIDEFHYNIEGQDVAGKAEDNFSWDARLLASAILPYGFTVQATGNYRSKRVITQGYQKPNASFDLGIRKTFLNKMFALAFNWRDVFNTRKRESYTSSDTFWRHQKNWRDPRVNFSLTWNFGNMSSKKKKQDDQSSGDEEPQSFGGYE